MGGGARQHPLPQIMNLRDKAKFVLDNLTVMRMWKISNAYWECNNWHAIHPITNVPLCHYGRRDNLTSRKAYVVGAVTCGYCLKAIAVLEWITEETMDETK